MDWLKENYTSIIISIIPVLLTHFLSRVKNRTISESNFSAKFDIQNTYINSFNNNQIKYETNNYNINNYITNNLQITSTQNSSFDYIFFKIFLILLISFLTLFYFYRFYELFNYYIKLILITGLFSSFIIFINFYKEHKLISVHPKIKYSCFISPISWILLLINNSIISYQIKNSESMEVFF